MAGNDDVAGQFLVPPAVTALRQETMRGRVPMVRTTSTNIREEREDLKEAAEQSLNVILDLGLDGIIRWVSPSWKEVVGTAVASVKGKPIADILLSNKDAFANAAESMKKDDSRSQIVRFQVLIGPSSVLKRKVAETETMEDVDLYQEDGPPEGNEEEEQILNLEGQGIMVYDRSSSCESHVSQRQGHMFTTVLLTTPRQCGCYDHLPSLERSP